MTWHDRDHDLTHPILQSRTDAHDYDRDLFFKTACSMTEAATCSHSQSKISTIVTIPLLAEG
jgi:hypothetical protein